MTKKEYLKILLELMESATADGAEAMLRNNEKDVQYYRGVWDGLFKARIRAIKLIDEPTPKETILPDSNSERLFSSALAGLDFAETCLETAFDDDDYKKYWKRRVREWKELIKEVNIYIIDD